jgi:membrane protease YdiL (CAAX protease family)/tetratricopeptide (TPR) repeat protein
MQERRATLERLLAQYDAELEARPNVVTSVERCRFIQTVVQDEQEDDGSSELSALHERCIEELSSTYPNEPKAVLYRLEQSYGQERVQIARTALGGPQTGWSPHQRARLHRAIAEQLDSEGDLPGASRAALEARSLDPLIDVALVLARAAKARGEPARAIALLSDQLERTDPPFSLHRKAELLAELGAYSDAQRALELLDAVPDVYRDPMLAAQVLTALERPALARAEYEEALSGQPYQRAEALRGRFELELRYGTREQASAAYEALRDHGFDQDPILRQRLRLFVAQPSAPWVARDLLGALTLLAGLLAASCLPLLVLGPIHYVGLVRRERLAQDSGGEHASSRAMLRQLWMLLAALIISELLVSFAFGPTLVAGWFDDAAGGTTATPSAIEVARVTLVWSFVFVVVAGSVVGWRQLTSLLRIGMQTRELASLVYKALGVVFLVSVVNAVLVRVLGLHAQPMSAASAALTTTETLRTVLNAYGVSGLIWVAVIAAPFAEELTFRYVLTETLRAHVPERWALGLQALAFALVHDHWQFWPTLFTVGVVASRLRSRTGSLLPSVALHAAWNALAVLLIVAWARS